MRGEAGLLGDLGALAIPFAAYEHVAVFTVAESDEVNAAIPGAHTKNLFLKDKKGGLWLVTCRDELKVDLNWLSRRLGAPRFSFGRPELLAEVLGVTPGSVTPLAVVNDTAGSVKVVLDQGLLAHEWVNCHPLQNDATTTLRAADLVRYMVETGHAPMLVEFD